MNPPPSQLERELKQARPFRSPAEEITVAIMRTAAIVRRRLAEVIEKKGVTLQQYNVLRILRGARGEPLPTLELRDRLIEPAPGITGLLDRLEAKHLIRRERSPADRRLVQCWITDAGGRLLQDLDAEVLAVDTRSARTLRVAEQKQLLALLAGIRGADD